MKLELVPVLLLLLCSSQTIYAQLTFTTPGRSAIGSSFVNTRSNGFVLTVTSGTDYAWIMSDLVTLAGFVPQEYYVTLLCASNVVDFGFQSVASSALFDTSRRLFGDGSSMETDKVSVYYPYQPTGGATTPIYISTPGTTLRWTATRYNSFNYIELRVRDSAGASLLGTPINSGGGNTAPANTNFHVSYAYAFGFEVLNCGQAKFCVQTAAEVAISPGNCDGVGSTTVYSCASNACISCDPNSACATCVNTRTTCASCNAPMFLYNGQCLFACPVGFVSFNNACYANCPAGSYLTSTTTCGACTSPCTQCIGTATNCVKCSATVPFVYSGLCYATCPTGTYSTSSNTCAPCGGFCKECSIVSTNCTSCQLVAPFLYNNFCYLSCPSGSYYIDDGSDTCGTCTSPCSECSGAATRCTSCVPGSPLLYNNYCYNTCPVGSYQATFTSCQTCATSCLACSSASSCALCADGYEVSGGQCKTKKSKVGMGVGLGIAGLVLAVGAGFLMRFFIKKRAARNGGAVPIRATKKKATGWGKALPTENVTMLSPNENQPMSIEASPVNKVTKTKTLNGFSKAPPTEETSFVAPPPVQTQEPVQISAPPKGKFGKKNKAAEEDVAEIVGDSGVKVGTLTNVAPINESPVTESPDMVASVVEEDAGKKKAKKLFKKPTNKALE